MGPIPVSALAEMSAARGAPLSPCRAPTPCSVLQNQGCSGVPAPPQSGAVTTGSVSPNCTRGAVAGSKVCAHVSYPNLQRAGPRVAGSTGAGEHELTPYMQVGALDSRESSSNTRCFQQRGSKMQPWGWNNFINHSGFLCKCTSFDSFFSSAALSCFLFLSCFKLHV